MTTVFKSLNYYKVKQILKSAELVGLADTGSDLPSPISMKSKTN